MYLNSNISTKEDFEKYSFLLDLNEKELSNLNNILKLYENYAKEYIIFENKYSDFVIEFNRLLENSNINLKEVNTKEEISFIKELIDKEIIKNIKYLNYLKYILNDNSIFVIDSFKDILNKGKILKKDFIEKLRNNNNIEKINSISKKINEMEKSIFNKEEKLKRIILLERQIINEIEVILNKLCFIFNIDYKDKDIKSKYLLITDLLNNKNNVFNMLKENLSKIENLLDSINSLNLPLNLNDIKNINEDSIEFLLEKLRLYQMHKKDNRVNINFMVR